MNILENIRATEIDYDTYYTLDPMNGRYIFASRMRDDYPEFDWCAGVAVIDLMSDEIVSEDATIARNNPKDVEMLGVAYRALDAYREADFHGTDGSMVDIISKVCKRAGATLYFIDDLHYGCRVSDMSTDRVARYALIGDLAQDLGREYVAMVNGERWAVHEVKLSKVLQYADLYESEVLDLTEFDYHGLATESVYGYIWGNVADNGDSSPSVYELMTAI